MTKKFLFDPTEFKSAMFGLEPDELGMCVLYICNELEGDPVKYDSKITETCYESKFYKDENGFARSKYLAKVLPKKRIRKVNKTDNLVQENLFSVEGVLHRG